MGSLRTGRQRPHRRRRGARTRNRPRDRRRTWRTDACREPRDRRRRRLDHAADRTRADRYPPLRTSSRHEPRRGRRSRAAGCRVARAASAPIAELCVRQRESDVTDWRDHRSRYARRSVRPSLRRQPVGLLPSRRTGRRLAWRERALADVREPRWSEPRSRRGAVGLVRGPPIRTRPRRTALDSATRRRRPRSPRRSVGRKVWRNPRVTQRRNASYRSTLGRRAGMPSSAGAAPRPSIAVARSIGTARGERLPSGNGGARPANRKDQSSPSSRTLARDLWRRKAATAVSPFARRSVIAATREAWRRPGGKLGLVRLNVGRLWPSVGIPSIDPHRSADKQEQREDPEQNVAKHVMDGRVDRPVLGVDRLDPVV